MSFKDLKLHPEILKALIELGYIDPTPIQEQAIPSVLDGKDLKASAQTGTGKTAAFLLPGLNLLSQPSKVDGVGPRILILVPTRELAMQVANEAVKFSKYLPRVKTVCIYGGAPYPIQIRELSRPYDILVATPGRLIDHMQRGRINFARTQMLVLDEADRMLDMGFIEPVEEIAAATPKSRQTLLFSATLKGNVLKLSKRLLNDPIEISVEPDHSAQANIEQRMHYADNLDHKHRLLNHLLIDPSLHQAIIFASTKYFVDELVEKLLDDGHHAAALHGDMNQRQRTRTIARLRQGDIKILVATDVAARGIDVPAISHVINFDLPNSAEDYVHRIGRTGRAGATGLAVSFASSKDMPVLRRIEQFTGHKIVPQVIEGMEPKSRQGPSSARPPRSRPDFRGSESRGPRSDSRGPRSDSRGPRSDSRGPRSDSRGPRSDSRGPDSRGPRSDSRGPDSREQREPRSEPREPRSDFRGPRSDSREPRSDSREPRSDSRPAPRGPRSETRRPGKASATSRFKPKSW